MATTPKGITEYTVTCEDAIAFLCESPTGYAEVDPEGVFRWVNEAYTRALNAHREQIIGTNFRKWTHPDDVGLDNDLAMKVATGEQSQYRMVKRYVRLGSTPRNPLIIWGELTVFGKFSDDGVFVGYRVSFVPFVSQSDGQSDIFQKVNKWLPALVQSAQSNWKTILAVVLACLGLTQSNLERLLGRLQDTTDLKKELDDLSPSSLPLPSSPLPGPSVPSTEPNN